MLYNNAGIRCVVYINKSGAAAVIRIRIRIHIVYKAGDRLDAHTHHHHT